MEMSKEEKKIEPASEEIIKEETQEPSLEETLQAENKDLKDKLLRTLADLENDRKRFEREKDEALKFAVTSFARDLLSVSDNLSRAISSISEESLKENNDLKTLYEGVSMTESELKKVFEKNKIEEIDPQDQPFNHNEHQAMLEIEQPNVQGGTVVQVMQKGYKLHDRLLRPAMVGVAKNTKS
jgi:molecular chaperone GrpE